MHATRVFPPRRSGSAFAPRGDASVLFGQLRRVRAADFQLEHRFAELGFAEEKEARVAGGVGLAVVGGFGGDVGLWGWLEVGSRALSSFGWKGFEDGTYQIDTLTERVAIHWSFWRGNTETLRQNPAVVGDSRAVP